MSYMAHPAGGSNNFDWFVNILIMVFYEILYLVKLEFSVHRTTKNVFLTDKAVYEPVRTERYSYRVWQNSLPVVRSQSVKNKKV